MIDRPQVSLIESVEYRSQSNKSFDLGSHKFARPERRLRRMLLVLPEILIDLQFE